MSIPLHLEAAGITRRYARQIALNEASFQVAEGCITGVIGPNGAGKTTLFECLAGLQCADAGSVSIRGTVVPPDQRKGQLFFVPDGICPWPELRLRDVLAFVAETYCRPLEQALAMQRRLGLEALGNARLGTLSKGERKRALLAIGLLTPHPLLMLDEPFDGLDFRQTLDVTQLLRSGEMRGGRTLLLSIHQLRDAERVCDRFILLSQGRVAGQGSLPELRERAGLPSCGPDSGIEEVFLALT